MAGTFSLSEPTIDPLMLSNDNVYGGPPPLGEPVQLFRVKCARKSGTQSLPLSRAQHASQQAVSGSFCCSCAFMFACLTSCRFVFPQGSEDTVTFGNVPPGVWGSRRAQEIANPKVKSGIYLGLVFPAAGSNRAKVMEQCVQ